MVDDPELLVSDLRESASAFRRLASGMLPGDFEKSLIELAAEYEHRATRFERGTGSKIEPAV
jgi:hypothetical protein